MTRDELVGDVKKAIEEVIPENKDLEADDIDGVETAVEEVLDNATSVINDGAGDDEEEETEK